MGNGYSYRIPNVNKLDMNAIQGCSNVMKKGKEIDGYGKQLSKTIFKSFNNMNDIFEYYSLYFVNEFCLPFISHTYWDEQPNEELSLNKLSNEDVYIQGDINHIDIVEKREILKDDEKIQKLQLIIRNHFFIVDQQSKGINQRSFIECYTFINNAKMICSEINKITGMIAYYVSLPCENFVIKGVSIASDEDTRQELDGPNDMFLTSIYSWLNSNLKKEFLKYQWTYLVIIDTIYDRTIDNLCTILKLQNKI